MTLKLIVANKAYSSWSLRPWILLKHFEIPFDEVVIPLDLPDTREKILAHSPTAKCPALRDGEIEIWESLAIIEYIAETFPDKPIWPRERSARALARALASEMHAGFSELRRHCPTQFLRSVRKIALTPEVENDVARIEQAWSRARERHGGAGPFLFGDFGAADAMFAPVVNRFHIYDVPVQTETRDYMDAVMALPAWKAWVRGAEGEPWRLSKYESI